MLRQAHRSFLFALIVVLPAGFACSTDGADGAAGAEADASMACYGDPCDSNEECPCSNVCFLGECAGPPNCDQAVLSWASAVEREDDTCLRDIGGYILHFGRDSGDYTEVIDVGEPCVEIGEVECGDGEMVMQYTCDYLFERPTDEDGTWFMALTTYTETGLESAYSAELEIELVCDRARRSDSSSPARTLRAANSQTPIRALDESSSAKRPVPSQLHLAPS